MIWQEPKFGNRYLNFLAGGWTFGGKMYIFSGTPFSSSDSKINAQINSGAGFSGTFLATVATPMQNNFGETGPNVFRGPGYFDIDTNVTKRFYIRETMNFELGAQFYNMLNHPNFTASITSGSLGTTSGDIAPPTSIYGSGHGQVSF